MAEHEELRSPAALDALARLRAEIERLRLPMETPGAAAMRAERDRTVRLLDDFVGRHMKQRDAPLLVVIGGPTGAGKSTLLNSLIGARVSASGVIRPTTAEPVLVYHPSDGPAFFRQRLLPNLAPATAGGTDLLTFEGTGADGVDPHMRLVPSEDVAPGLAIVDSPDFDSYRVANHDLASDLLDIADLWLYVTTGTDYAKAVPWEFLRAAAGRKLGIATVLNRIRPAEAVPVAGDLGRLLADNDLGEAPLFVVPEVELIDDRIPVAVVEPLWRWLDEQAGDPAARQGYVERAVEGTLDEVLAVTERLATAAADQVVAERRLRVDLTASFRQAREQIREALTESALELGHGAAEEEAPEPARARGGGRFRRLLGGPAAEASPQRAATDALVGAIGRFTRRVNHEAVARVAERWSAHPAAANIGLDRMLELAPEVDRLADAAVREWLQDVSAATFLPPDGAVTGARPAPGASLRTALAVLSPAPAGNLEPLRDNLVRRLSAVLDEQEARLADLLESVSGSGVADLRAAGARLREAWRGEPGGPAPD